MSFGLFRMGKAKLATLWRNFISRIVLKRIKVLVGVRETCIPDKSLLNQFVASKPRLAGWASKMSGKLLNSDYRIEVAKKLECFSGFFAEFWDWFRILQLSAKLVILDLKFRNLRAKEFRLICENAELRKQEFNRVLLDAGSGNNASRTTDSCQVLLQKWPGKRGIYGVGRKYPDKSLEIRRPESEIQMRPAAVVAARPLGNGVTASRGIGVASGAEADFGSWLWFPPRCVMRQEILHLSNEAIDQTGI